MWVTAYLSPPLLPQPHTNPNLLSVDCCWDREGIGKVRSCSDAEIDLEKEKEIKQSSESWCDLLRTAFLFFFFLSYDS